MNASENGVQGSQTSSRRWVLILAVMGVIAAGLLVLFLLQSVRELQERVGELNDQLKESAEELERMEALAEGAGKRANRAEERAEQASMARDLAETAQKQAQSRAQQAEREALAAKREAESVKEEAGRVKEEADRIRRERAAEMERLQQALSKIAETRWTALGLVMNLGSDFIQFEFDRAHLRSENRELLSRITGILLTSSDFRIYVHGHTDNVGTQEYNQKLSERRARAVRDYLVEAGIEHALIATKGFGKTRPLVRDSTAGARSKNRRVEIGIVNTLVEYQGPAPKEGEQAGGG